MGKEINPDKFMLDMLSNYREEIQPGSTVPTSRTFMGLESAGIAPSTLVEFDGKRVVVGIQGGMVFLGTISVEHDDKHFITISSTIITGENGKKTAVNPHRIEWISEK